MQLSQLCYGIEKLDRCRKRNIQMVTPPYELGLLYVFKSERNLVGNYATPKMIGYVVEKKVVSV